MIFCHFLLIEDDRKLVVAFDCVYCVWEFEHLYFLLSLSLSLSLSLRHTHTHSPSLSLLMLYSDVSKFFIRIVKILICGQILRDHSLPFLLMFDINFTFLAKNIAKVQIGNFFVACPFHLR